jgi:hypothetical protein
VKIREIFLFVNVQNPVSLHWSTKLLKRIADCDKIANIVLYYLMKVRDLSKQ